MPNTRLQPIIMKSPNGMPDFRVKVNQIQNLVSFSASTGWMTLLYLSELLFLPCDGRTGQSKVPLEPYNSHKISHIPCLPHCFFFLISFQLIIYLLSLNSKSRQLNIKRIYEFLSVRKRVIFSICPFSIRAFLAIF